MLRVQGSTAEADATLELLLLRLDSEQVEIESAEWPSVPVTPPVTADSIPVRQQPARSLRVAPVADLGRLADELRKLWRLRRSAGSR